MAYQIFDPAANVSRYLRGGAQSAKAAPIDTTVVPAANTSQNNPGTPILLNAGDIVFIGTNGKIASLNTAGTNKANTATHCGIAETSYPLRLRQGVYESSIDPVGDPPEASIRVSGQFKMRTTAGESYVPGITPLYLGGDAQTVTTVSTGNGTALGKAAVDQRPLGRGVELGQTIIGIAGGSGAVGGEVILDYIAAVTI